MDSLKASDAEAGRHAVAPRVTLADIEGAIAKRFDITADKALAPYHATPLDLRTLSICIVVMSNGFVVTGTSRPVVADNFNAELGKKLAYEDAIRQLWPLMGFSLRDRLAAL